MSCRNALAFAWALSAACAGAATADAEPQVLESARVRLAVSPRNGSYTFVDKRTGVAWMSSPAQARFGSVTFAQGNGERTVALDRFQLATVRDGHALALMHVLPETAVGAEKKLAGKPLLAVKYSVALRPVDIESH